MKFLIITFLLSWTNAFGQQTINKLTTKDLTINGTYEVNSTTMGSQPCPRMTEVQRDAISSPEAGDCIWNTNSLTINAYNGSTWGSIGGGGLSAWVTAYNYKSGDVVIESNKIYKALSNHTSGTFATDLAGGKWVELSQGVTDHTQLLNIGTNTHAQIDTHIANTSNPHATTKAQVGLSAVPNLDTSTTANITDSTNKRFVTDAEKTVIGNTSGTNSGDLLSKGQSEGSTTVTKELDVPYNQLTTTSSGVRLIETGDENMLVNPGMEGQNTSGVANGWTNSAGTATITTTAGEFTSGLKAQKIVLSAQTLNFSQTVTTPSGIQKQGYVRATYKVPAAVSDFSICAMVDAVEQTCVPAARLLLDNLYHTIDIPLSFGTTSAGIKYKTLTAATGTVFFDASGVYQGLANVSKLELDNVYSAYITTTSGAITSQSKTFVASCTAANPTVCTFSAGIFTVAPHCVANISPAASSAFMSQIRGVSSTGFTVETMASTNGASQANQPFFVICQKQGADYVNASSSTYSQASADYGWTSFTGTFSAGFGTVSPSTNNCKKRRAGQNLEVRCSIVTGTVAGSIASLDVPDSLSIDTTAIILNNTTTTTGNSVGEYYAQAASGYGAIVTATGTSATKVYFGNLTTNSTNTVPQNGSAIFGSTQNVTLQFSIPIVGWTNSSFIVGSFEGIEKCTSDIECRDTFTATIQTGSVIYKNTSAAWVSCTNAAVSVCTFTAGIFTVPPTCTATADNASTNVAGTNFTGNITSASVSINQMAMASGSPYNGRFYLQCSKSYPDSVPKTAKIASSIGVPTVPGIVGTNTGDRIDTFSVNYGSSSSFNAVCSTSTCYIDQIGNVVSSITRTGTGAYSLNLSKTYTKLKCTQTARYASTGLMPIDLICFNANACTFQLTNSGGANVDGWGTIMCQGTY